MTALEKGKPSFNRIEWLRDVPEPMLLFKITPENHEHPERINISDRDVSELRRLHEVAVADFRNLAPTLPFVRGTRGIVTTASMDAMAILTSSLRMLRNAGSKLPVEVWMHRDHEYDESRYMCEEVFPDLMAACKIMTHYLPESMEFKLHEKFIYKLYTLLFSTFEEILFLDCDLFPVMNPDSVFISEPFTSSGFVLWPDHWATTISKVYYDVVGHKRLPMKERQSTESGALLINKTLMPKQFFLPRIITKMVQIYTTVFLHKGHRAKGIRTLTSQPLRVMVSHSTRWLSLQRG